MYNQDYKILTAEDTILLESINQQENLKRAGQPYTDIPLSKGIRHFRSLFPNNYLDYDDLQNTQHIESVVNNFELIVNDNTKTERHILNFIKNNEAYFLVGSIFSGFKFGHHAAFLFPEFQLSTTYKADYLLVGKGSGGFQFIFVEFENIYESITITDGNFGNTIRKGLRQINDWNTWLEANFQSLKIIFNEKKCQDINLPKEFYELDKSRIHYVVVAGLREDYNEKTNSLRRTLKRESNITILHYNNIIDDTRNIIGNKTY
jgi:hypothetical protein